MTPDLPHMICFALYSASHAMQAAYKPLLDPLGLTYPQYLVLTDLWGQNDQTVGALGRALRLESNTLTPLLKRMEAQGLISRSRDKADERQVRIRLTQEGQAMQARAAHVPGCLLERTGLTLDQASDLRDAITALRDRLLASRD
ncbi:MarR family transcriptional regulator [Gemmobacter megaterium]|nr:MarR family transcriptional regulator [Gemmobacter megaterium]GGE03735.1 MarR family transcriptional regulator [Gemmobacter megaterium]